MLTYKIVDFNANTGQIKIVVNEYDFGIIPIDLTPDETGMYPTGAALDSYIRGFIPEHEMQRLLQVRNAKNVSTIQSLVQPTQSSTPVATNGSTEHVFVI